MCSGLAVREPQPSFCYQGECFMGCQHPAAASCLVPVLQDQAYIRGSVAEQALSACTRCQLQNLSTQ